LQFLALSVRVISGLNRVVGQVLSWLALGIVLVCFAVVQIWMQDLYVWLSGAMFTGVAGFALMRDDHVRVDIFYRPWSIRKKAIADLIGTLIFLIPYVVVVLVYAWPFVARSWRLYEGSANVGGMPGLFILKSFISFCCDSGAAGPRHHRPLDPRSARPRGSAARAAALPDRQGVTMEQMLIGEVLSGLMFFGIIVTLLLGYPVAFSLAGTALIFGSSACRWASSMRPTSAHRSSATPD
jgi:TRAP-type mannitol/chloroaromatic compound transport system permease small subunit